MSTRVATPAITIPCFVVRYIPLPRPTDCVLYALCFDVKVEGRRRQWVLYRRYSTLRDLHQKLEKLCLTTTKKMLPAFPQRMLGSSNRDKAKLNKRRQHLADYYRQLLPFCFGGVGGDALRTVLMDFIQHPQSEAAAGTDSGSEYVNLATEYMSGAPTRTSGMLSPPGKDYESADGTPTSTSASRLSTTADPFEQFDNMPVNRDLYVTTRWRVPDKQVRPEPYVGISLPQARLEMETDGTWRVAVEGDREESRAVLRRHYDDICVVCRMLRNDASLPTAIEVFNKLTAAHRNAKMCIRTRSPSAGSCSSEDAVPHSSGNLEFGAGQVSPRSQYSVMFTKKRTSAKSGDGVLSPPPAQAPSSNVSSTSALQGLSCNTRHYMIVTPQHIKSAAAASTLGDGHLMPGATTSPRHLSPRSGTSSPSNSLPSSPKIGSQSPPPKRRTSTPPPKARRSLGDSFAGGEAEQALPNVKEIRPLSELGVKGKKTAGVFVAPNPKCRCTDRALCVGPAKVAANESIFLCKGGMSIWVTPQPTPPADGRPSTSQAVA